MGCAVVGIEIAAISSGIELCMCQALDEGMDSIPQSSRPVDADATVLGRDGACPPCRPCRRRRRCVLLRDSFPIW